MKFILCQRHDILLPFFWKKVTEYANFRDWTWSQIHARNCIACLQQLIVWQAQVYQPWSMSRLNHWITMNCTTRTESVSLISPLTRCQWRLNLKSTINCTKTSWIICNCKIASKCWPNGRVLNQRFQGILNACVKPSHLMLSMARLFQTQ